MCVSFFFQAEDGIRDRNVTGVQTCALPISMKHCRFGCASPRAIEPTGVHGSRIVARSASSGMTAIRVPRAKSPSTRTKIGRASCRERVEIAVGRLDYQKKGQSHQKHRSKLI